MPNYYTTVPIVGSITLMIEYDDEPETSHGWNTSQDELTATEQAQDFVSRIVEAAQDAGEFEDNNLIEIDFNAVPWIVRGNATQCDHTETFFEPTD